MNLMHRAIALRRSRPVAQCLSASAVPHVRAMPTFRARPEQLPFLSRSRTSLAVRLNKQHALLVATVQRPFKLSWCRPWRAVEGKCWSVCGRCRSAKVGAPLAAPCRAAAGAVAFKPYLAFPPPVTPNPSFKRTASPPLNSNVRRRKTEHRPLRDVHSAPRRPTGQNVSQHYRGISRKTVNASRMV